MRDRRRRDAHSRAPLLRLFFLSCALLSALTFSALHLFGAAPLLLLNRAPLLSTSDDARSFSKPSHSLEIREAVSFPDQLLLFLKSPSLAADRRLLCLYFPPSSYPHPALRLPPMSAHSHILRCPAGPSGFRVSVSSRSPPVSPRSWDRLAYAALLDRDNSTLVFAKGLGLRPGRLADASRYECVFGWDFAKPKYLLAAPALSAAQEVVRCLTPLSVVLRALLPSPAADPPYVSIHTRGRGGGNILPSVARPEALPNPRAKKAHTMCVCTMLRNQARFLKEWIAYHSRIGVERWFIYDNNSDDEIEQVLDEMRPSLNSKISRHVWPWIKTQEAGFAHCALRARDFCEWVGFIDVDEFLFFPNVEVTLHDVLRNYSRSPSIGELRTACHTFGPSGRNTHPAEGVTVGYTCRMGLLERHKSIVRPDALSPSLINVVHHFHLKEGWRYVNMKRGVMVINHYKYQVWELFKEKFYRRVATYVADWQDEENVGSKDRAPGLGTKAIEPPDWAGRFCEVDDTGLRDWVLKVFVDPETGQLPW